MTQPSQLQLQAMECAMRSINIKVKGSYSLTTSCIIIQNIPFTLWNSIYSSYSNIRNMIIKLLNYKNIAKLNT